MSIIPALQRLRQEDHEFQAGLGYTEAPCPKKTPQENTQFSYSHLKIYICMLNYNYLFLLYLYVLIQITAKLLKFSHVDAKKTLPH
jgi:hypothetical protein